MKKFLFTFSFLLSSLYAKVSPTYDTSFERYHKLLKEQKLGQLGNYKYGEIEVIEDSKLIAQVEELQRKKFMRSGMSESEAAASAKIGVIAEDGYWVFVRDAVFFPTGMMGSYNRILKKSELQNSYSGAAVLPILKDKRVVLIVSYRHATRSWQLEVVRGYSEKSEDAIATAERELLEETGLVGTNFNLLGRMNPDSGTVSSCVPIYTASVRTERGMDCPDDSEAISCCKAFTVTQLKRLLVAGSFKMKIAGKERDVFVRDSFITYAIMQAELQDLL